jgi:tetratricopeptide (TPR) repeat protein
MQFDPNNKVVKLCAEGMQAEAEGKITEAHALFQQAWDIATDDFEAFTAAHYLARNQANPNDVLKWNLEALNRANKINDVEVGTHYPSLYLNIGKSYENLNDKKLANEYYALAADYSSFLPPGKYSDMIRAGIVSGLKRTGTTKFSNAALDELIDKWCVNRNLKPLGLVLPAYNSNLGTDIDLNKLMSSLSYLSATQCLGEDEQQVVDGLIMELTAVANNK